jgi:hypothetical protein
MKMYVEGKFLSVVKKDFKDSKTGDSVDYYKLHLMTDGEPSTFSCSEAVFNEVNKLLTGGSLCEMKLVSAEVDVFLGKNGKDGSARIVKILETKK